MIKMIKEWIAKYKLRRILRRDQKAWSCRTAVVIRDGADQEHDFDTWSEALRCYVKSRLSCQKVFYSEHGKRY